MSGFESDNVVLEGEDFDAFNEETFGDKNEAWDEDAHQDILDMPACTDGVDDFFDLQHGSNLIGETLEPAGLTTEEDRLTLKEDEVDFEGLSIAETQEIADLLPPQNGSKSREEDLLNYQFANRRVQHRRSPHEDPPILNMRALPPVPPLGLMVGQFPPRMPPPPPHLLASQLAGVPPLPVGMAIPPAGFPPPQPYFPHQQPVAFSDPAVMALRHRFPHNFSRQRVFHPPVMQAKSLQEVERELLHSAQRNDFSRRPPPIRPNHHHSAMLNNRPSFDDKNKETFGEEFVVDHHSRQQRSHHQRYRYGDRDSFQEQQLITPGHVHVLGILRGTRELQDEGMRKSEPTGNPKLDMEREREQDLRWARDHFGSGRNDEYSGLMSHRERQWIINIQLSQLKCDNPYIDDYYYTVFNQKRENEANLAKEATQQANKQRRELQRQLSLGEEARDTSRQLKRDEEGPQLLLPAETSGTEGKEDDYTPKQFTNSLGKLQAITVKAPRKMLDVGIMINEVDGSSNAQRESRNFKQILLELERMYSMLIDVEDCGGKLMALPTNTVMRVQVEEERDEAARRLGSNLAVEFRLRKYVLVRKGKALLARALRLLDESQMVIVCTTLFSLFGSAVRRDRDDQLLSVLWEAGISKHLNNVKSVKLIASYLQLLKSSGLSSNARLGSKSPPPNSHGRVGLKIALASPLGVSAVCACVHKIGALATSRDQPMLERLLTDLGTELSEVKDITEPASIPEQKLIFPTDSGLISKEQVHTFTRLLTAANGGNA